MHAILLFFTSILLFSYSIHGGDTASLTHFLNTFDTNLKILQQLMDAQEIPQELSDQEKSNSDTLVINALRDIALREGESSSSLKDYQNYIVKRLSEVQQNKQFHKSAELAVLLQGPNALTYFLSIATSKGFEESERDYLRSFYSESIGYFNKPAQRYTAIFKQFKNRLKLLFFAPSRLEPSNITSIMRTIILTFIMHSRKPIKTASAQKQSDQKLISMLVLIHEILETRHDDPTVMSQVWRMLDWLRINPEFMYYRGMLWIGDKGYMDAPLAMVLQPDRYGFIKRSDSAWSGRLLRDAFAAHTFGNKDDPSKLQKILDQQNSGTVFIVLAEHLKAFV